jgi:hypothetical protein
VANCGSTVKRLRLLPSRFGGVCLLKLLVAFKFIGLANLLLLFLVVGVDGRSRFLFSVILNDVRRLEIISVRDLHFCPSVLSCAVHIDGVSCLNCSHRFLVS